MKVLNLKIRHWRFFRDVELSISEESPLICLVGANGTGKTHIFELIAAFSHFAGFTPGMEQNRGNIFGDDHDFEITLKIDSVDIRQEDVPNSFWECLPQWDKTLRISSTNATGVKCECGGVLEGHLALSLAQQVIGIIKVSDSVHFQILDANRAYPKRNMHPNEVGGALETDWIGPIYRKSRSFVSSTALYEEWIKYFIGVENQTNSAFAKACRQIHETGGQQPKWKDPFQHFGDAVREVLPHLAFLGIEPRIRTLLFETGGHQVNFDQLSGGEREIAFLIGQIDRFDLRKGLFMLDEPELHLNPDLIRAWIGYLRKTIQDGQIWIATHSMEAVEAAGASATFLLERNAENNEVHNGTRLDSIPVYTNLSRTLGSPAFSISGEKFIFIEGEPGLGERSRFYKLTKAGTKFKFIEAGSRREVLRRVNSIRSLAQETEVDLHIGGVVDLDLSLTNTVEKFENSGILVLGVHEVENLFLFPPVLIEIADKMGIASFDAIASIRTAGITRAGSWIFNRAVASLQNTYCPTIAGAARGWAKQRDFNWISANFQDWLDEIGKLSKISITDEWNMVENELAIAKKEFENHLESPDFWKYCEGKEVSPLVAQSCRLTTSSALEDFATNCWEQKSSLIPDELTLLRQYVESI